MTKRNLILSFSLIIAFFGLLFFTSLQLKDDRPNVILIMADDMGYECLSSYGALCYQTPKLDSLAQRGIRFNHAISQPLCTPSRVKIMTGKYNYRNYEYFGYLNPKQKTFGHLFKEAGYKTCIVGKWQLNGIYHDLRGNQDKDRPYEFGFDEYCLWQLTKNKNKGERYAKPLIEENGVEKRYGINDYGPDIFTNYILEYIEKNKNNPFFIYYPMVLVHDPFVPTPDSPEWQDSTRRYEDDTTYFADMMLYTDKIVGKIADKLKHTGLDKNTLLIFTADNGTHRSIVTLTDDGPYKGGKGMTTNAGTKVPMIAYWPKHIKQSTVYEPLIEFSDFFTTFAEMLKLDESSDGKSFYSLLKDQDHTPRATAFVHYDPQWGKWVNQWAGRFARTETYKLYQDGSFYNVKQDPREEYPLTDRMLSSKEVQLKNSLQAILNNKPFWEKSVEN
jgi:arylsulfatase A